MASRSGAGKPFNKTAGNILTPVDAFSSSIGKEMPSPHARGENKSPGSDPFPTSSGARAKSSPLNAFGLGGKD